jgi:hypothetical protein
VALTLHAQLLLALPLELLSQSAFELDLLLLCLRAQGFDLLAERLELPGVLLREFLGLGFVALFEVLVVLPELLLPLLGRPFELLDLGLVALLEGLTLLTVLFPQRGDLVFCLHVRGFGIAKLLQLLAQPARFFLGGYS